MIQQEFHDKEKKKDGDTQKSVMCQCVKTNLMKWSLDQLLNDVTRNVKTPLNVCEKLHNITCSLTWLVLSTVYL